jgi:hypothetical protein
MLARIAALSITLAVSGCALFEPEPEPAPPPPPPAPKKVEAPRIESQPLKHLANRDLKPMPIKPLNVKTRCTFRDEVTGTRGRLDVQVKEDEVQRFSAEVNIPKRGICRFDFKDFAQANKKQHPVTMTTKTDTCAVRMWEQGPRVTVSFNECTAKCEGNAYEYLWPILIDSKTGRCV